jgi:addiction module RelE/StbE family toxin
MKLVWTKEALISLQEIEYFISQDNPQKAIDFVNRLISKAERIVDNPKSGRIVPELSIEQIREVIFKNYRIVYLIKKKSIDILTVFEGHRLLRVNEIRKKMKNG